MDNNEITINDKMKKFQQDVEDFVWLAEHMNELDIMDQLKILSILAECVDKTSPIMNKYIERTENNLAFFKKHLDDTIRKQMEEGDSDDEE